MKLHKALKIKNRLAGEVTRLSQLLQRENSKRSDNTSQVNAADVFNDLNTVRSELVRLKAAIARANIGIYEKIERISELKNQINLLNSLPAREGQEKSAINQQTYETHEWKAFLNRQAIDGLIVAIQQDINKTQDEVDEYNASTEVEF